jgi:hypothetical protein
MKSSFKPSEILPMKSSYRTSKKNFRDSAYEKLLQTFRDSAYEKKLSQSFRGPTYDKAFSSDSVVKVLNFVDTVTASVPVLPAFSYMKSEVLRVVNMKNSIF